MKYIGLDLSKHFRYAMQSTGGVPFVFSPTETGLSAFEKWLREISDGPVFIGLDSASKAGRVLSDALYRKKHQIYTISSAALKRVEQRAGAHGAYAIALCTELGYGRAYAPLRSRERPNGFWAFHPSWTRTKPSVLSFCDQPSN